MRRAIVATLVVAAAPAGGARAEDAPPGAPGTGPARAPQTIIVRYARGADAGDRLSARRDASVERDSALPVSGSEVVDPKPGVDVDDAVHDLNHNDDVVYAEPNEARNSLATPNDPFFAQQWALDNSGQDVNGTEGEPGADIGAPLAWDLATAGNPPVPVGIVDSGIDPTDRDLAPSLWTDDGEIPGNGVDDDGDGYVDDVHGWDFVESDNEPLDANGHGTHVSGIIGARGNDGYGVTGVAWRSRLMPLRVLDAQGRGWTSDIVAAETYAARNGARVVNLSLGGTEYSRAEHDAIAAAPGVLFVAAAGNDKNDNDASPRYPCDYDLPNVVCVAATDSDDHLADYSNYGTQTVDLGAPGTNIVSTWPGGQDALLSGTSMAAPQVAGAAALAFSADPSLTATEVASMLRETADPVPGLAGKVATGGRLDLGKLLERIAPPGSAGGGDNAGQPKSGAAPKVPTARARAADRHAPGVSVTVTGSHTVSALVSGRLGLRARCSEACTVSLRLDLGRAASRRLHVGDQLLAATARLRSAGGVTRNVRLGAQTRRRLAAARGLASTVTASATDSAGNRSKVARAALRLRSA